MNMIHFISTSTVRPSSETYEFRRRIELSPFDLKLLPITYMQKGLLFHKPTGNSAIDFVERLKAALSAALDVFYPLAGRLVALEGGDGTASFHIDCNGAGALFVHAAAEGIATDDIIRPETVPVGIVSSFFQMNGVQNCDAAFYPALPLVAVQVTELSDGVFVACSMSHVAADGAALWGFFKLWSTLSHGGAIIDSLEHRPDFGRKYFGDVNVDLPIRIPFSHPTMRAERFVPPSSDILYPKIFHFSKEEIAELKKKANAVIGIVDYEISSLQALLAHFWVSTTRSRRLDAAEEVCFLLSVDLRARLEPPLPQGYFGNALGLAAAKCAAGELLAQGTGRAAERINRAVAAHAAVDAGRLFEDLAKHPPAAHFGKLPRNKLIAGSSPRFGMFGNDFGWGRPIGLRSGTWNGFDGRTMVHPGVEEGSVDLEVCLSPEAFRALQCDTEFMNSLSM